MQPTHRVWKLAIVSIAAATGACSAPDEEHGTAAQSVDGEELIAFPDFYAQPGQHPFREQLSALTNESVDPFSGTLHLSHVDVHLPGNGGMDLQVVRTYRQLQDFQGRDMNVKSFERWFGSGLGWTIHFGRILGAPLCSGTTPQQSLTTMSDNPTFESPDGSRRHFVKPASGGSHLVSADFWRAECRSTYGGWTVLTPQGLRYDATYKGRTSRDWYVTRISDPFGNRIDISYGRRSGQIPYLLSATAKDASGGDTRSVSFTYDAEKRRITRVTAQGKTWTYRYDTVDNYLTGEPAKLLTQVRLPTSHTWKYKYQGFTNISTTAGNWSLEQVTYPLGGTIKYDYGFVDFNPTNSLHKNTVVSKRVVGGPSVAGGTWNYDYTSSTTEDKTVITFPHGKYTYRHYGRRSEGSGSLWKVGLLKSLAIYDTRYGELERVTHSWGRVKLSSEPFGNLAVGDTAKDDDTYAPRLLKKISTRESTNYETAFSDFNSYNQPEQIDEKGPAGTRRTDRSFYINTGKWIIDRVEDETIAGVGTIDRTFDSSTGALARESRFGVVQKFTRYANGEVQRATDPLNNITTYSSYKRGIPQRENHPESVTLSRRVNDSGTIAEETNGRGHTTKFGYDALGRVTSIDLPVRSDISISRSGRTRTLTRGGYSEQTTYDGFGRVRSVTREGIKVSTSYDALGNKTFESYPGSSSGTGFTVDVLGRTRKVSHPGGANVTISYASSGRQITTDERGKKTTRYLGGFGNPDEVHLTKIVAPEGVSIEIGRNDIGQMTSAKQGLVTRSYGYNSRRQLTSLSEPERGTVTYGRDAAGNMTSMRVGGNLVASYSYDALNRLTHVNYADSGTRDISRSYNKNGQLTVVDNGIARWSSDYDANGKRRLEQLVTGGRTLRLSYGRHSQLGYVSQLTYPSGMTVDYQPDDLGRPSKALPFAHQVSFFPGGQLKRVGLGPAGGSVPALEFTLTTRLWPNTVSSSGGASAVVDLNYDYDRAGNVAAISNAIEPTQSVSSITYDDLNRLTSAKSSWGQGRWAYDALGNITSRSFAGQTFSYSYPSGAGRRLDKMTVSGTASGWPAVAAFSFSYDSHGNVTHDGQHAFRFDKANQLRDVDNGKRRYEYDGHGNRVRAVVDGKTHLEFSSAAGQLLGEYDTNGSPVREYVYVGRRLIAQKGQISQPSN